MRLAAKVVRRGPTTMRSWCGASGVGPSVSQLLAGEVDEDGLEAGLGDEMSATTKPPPSAAEITRASRRSEPLTLSSSPASVLRVRVTPSTPFSRAAASRSWSPGALIVTMVSIPTDCFSSAGVSSARIRPWSMIATRSQSWSASSM